MIVQQSTHVGFHERHVFIGSHETSVDLINEVADFLNEIDARLNCGSTFPADDNHRDKNSVVFYSGTQLTYSQLTWVEHDVPGKNVGRAITVLGCGFHTVFWGCASRMRLSLPLRIKWGPSPTPDGFRR